MTYLNVTNVSNGDGARPIYVNPSDRGTSQETGRKVESKIIAGYLLDRVKDIKDMVISAFGVTNAYGADDVTSASITDEDMTSVNGFADSTNEQEPYLWGAKGEAVKNGSGRATIFAKYVIFSQKDKKGKTVNYLDDIIMDNFRSQKDFPELFILGKIISALNAGKSGWDTPAELIAMFNKFQDNCNKYGIYAWFHERNAGKGSYELIVPDSVLGRQTAKALLFVYELGQIAVKFGIVESFADYVQIFNKVSKKSLTFNDIVRKVQNIVAKLKQNPATEDLILPKEKIDNVNGIIQGNVGEAILQLYHNLDKVKDANLMNISEEENAGELLVLPFVLPEDAKEGTNYTALVEAKQILFALDIYKGADSLEKCNGTWDGALSPALVKFGITKNVINKENAGKLLAAAREYYQTLLDEVNSKLDGLGSARSEVEIGISNAAALYKDSEPESICKSIVELKNIRAQENVLLGTISEKDAQNEYEKLLAEYNKLLAVMKKAEGLLTTEESKAVKNIDATVKNVYNLVYTAKTPEAFNNGAKIAKTTYGLCRTYIVLFWGRIFEVKEKEARDKINKLTLDLPAKDEEIDSTIAGYYKTIDDFQSNEITDLNSIITNMQNEGEAVSASDGKVKDLDAIRAAKRKELDIMQAMLSLEKARRELVRFVNKTMEEVNLCRDRKKLDEIKANLNIGYKAKFEDDKKPIKEQDLLFAEDVASAEDKDMPTVNKVGRKANSIVSTAKGLGGVGEKLRVDFLSRKVTPEVKRLIDKITERSTMLNVAFVELGYAAPVVRGNVTPEFAARVQINRVDPRFQFTPEKLVFEGDDIPDAGVKKVLPFIHYCHELARGSKDIYKGAKALYDKVLAAIELKNIEEGQEGTYKPGFDQALEIEWQAKQVFLPSMCVATAFADKWDIRIDKGSKDAYNLGGETVTIIRSVNKALYERIAGIDK